MILNYVLFDEMPISSEFRRRISSRCIPWQALLIKLKSRFHYLATSLGYHTSCANKHTSDPWAISLLNASIGYEDSG